MKKIIILMLISLPFFSCNNADYDDNDVTGTTYSIKLTVTSNSYCVRIDDDYFDLNSFNYVNTYTMNSIGDPNPMHEVQKLSDDASNVTTILYIDNVQVFTETISEPGEIIYVKK